MSFYGPRYDLDIAIRVTPEEFNILVKSRFKTPNPESSKYRTMEHAIKTGKITSRYAGTSKIRDELETLLGMKVDLSIIRIGGPFDNGPYIPLP